MGGLTAGTGSSTANDGTTAGREAAAAAVTGLCGQPPALALVFGSVRYDLPDVVAGIRAVMPGVPLAGASSSGYFHDGVLTAPGQGVTVVAMTSGPYRFGVASTEGLQAEPFETGRRLARAARADAGAEPSAHAAIILLAAGFAADLQALLNGLYRVAGAAVPIIGGSAGDDRRLECTWVVHDDQVVTDAAVAVWVGSPTPLRVRSGHGWQPISPPMLVTHADGMVVDKIGGRPAVEVFREHVDSNQGQTGEDRVGGWHSAHAFGLIEPDGSQLIRGAYADAEDVLRTFIPLPPYAAVQVVSSGPDAVLDVVEPLVDEVVDGADAGLLLAFDCVARLDILGERAAEEPKRLQAAAGSARTAGFCTYGEFARTVGVSGVHNATLAVIAL